MDIHAPEKPIHSLKEFAIHIAVVTIGILIALSLEGLREVVHDHLLVRETRANFVAELRQDLDNSVDEQKQVRRADEQLKALVADLPKLRRNPTQIAARLDAITNPGYFFGDSAWQAALSTGALAHVSTEELGLYAASYTGIHSYLQCQARALEADAQVKAYFEANTTITPAMLSLGIERLLIFARAEQNLRWVGFQMQNSIRVALGQPPDKLMAGDRPSR